MFYSDKLAQVGSRGEAHVCQGSAAFRLGARLAYRRMTDSPEKEPDQVPSHISFMWGGQDGMTQEGKLWARLS